MAVFRKEKVPEIPASPTLPNLPYKSEPLPAFPSNSKSNSINQEIIKSAISDNLGDNEVKAQNMEEDLKVTLPSIPPSTGKESILNQDKIPNPPSPKKPITVQAPVSISKKEETVPESIFVRIDKFQLAKKNSEQIKKKIEEIGIILDKINEEREKEEEELKNWAAEITDLKIKLSEIDSNIFSQI